MLKNSIFVHIFAIVPSFKKPFKSQIMFRYVFERPEHESGVSFAVKHKGVPVLALSREKLEY